MIEKEMGSIFKPLLLTVVVGNEALIKSEEKRHQKVIA